MSKVYTVFNKCEEIDASSAAVAIRKYIKLHPESKIEKLKAAPSSAVKTITQDETVEIPEQGVVITTTPKKVA